MNRRSFLSTLTTVAAGSLLAGAAEAMPTWVYLGKRKVNFLWDHDEIHVGVAKGNYRKIKINVTGNGLFMYDLDVIYHNGASDHIPVRWHIPQGGGTRVIDLRGGDRFIRNVQFTYGKPLNGNGRTYVHLWGRT